MKEEFSFKFLGEISCFPLLVQLVSSFTEEEWTGYKERRKTGGIASKESDTIPLIYDPKLNINFKNYHQKYKDFKIYIDEISELAMKHLDCGDPKQAIVTRLSSGSEIKRHKDKGPITAKTHRVHLPIITNEKCIFTVGDESINMKAGEVWVIDNVDKYHSVINGGEIERIHLIVDFS